MVESARKLPGLHLYAYVGNTGDGTISVIDLIKLSPVATIIVGPGPSGVRAHPKRPEIWGVSSAGGYAWVLDVQSNQITARIPVGTLPYALDFSPDGRRAYVAASGSNTIAAIDTASRQIVARGLRKLSSFPATREMLTSPRHRRTTPVSSLSLRTRWST